jgi:alkylhydroperoxidase family enzyme
MATTIKRVDPAENEFLASLESKAKQPNPFFRAMANRPEALKNFVPFYGSLMGPGSVDRRTKAFCIAANLPGGRKSGLTEEQLSAIEKGTAADSSGLGFSPADIAAMRYARELTRTARATDSREEMFAHFTHEQVVEITMTIAMANWTNRFNNGLEIFPE